MATRKTVTRKPAARVPRRTFGDDLIEAMQEVVAIERGEREPVRVIQVAVTARDATATPAPEYSPAAIKQMRERLNLSQPTFAGALNVKPMTLRGWEQGTRKPDSAARRLLQIVEQHPEWILSHVQAR